MINKTEVRTLLLEFYCENCKTRMEYTGETRPTKPPKYVHICPTCKIPQDVTNKIYPAIEYEVIKKNTEQPEDNAARET
jgi:hypothetical protein